jgi:hypothetical protein
MAGRVWGGRAEGSAPTLGHDQDMTTTSVLPVVGPNDATEVIQPVMPSQPRQLDAFDDLFRESVEYVGPDGTALMPVVASTGRSWQGKPAPQAAEPTKRRRGGAAKQAGPGQRKQPSKLRRKLTNALVAVVALGLVSGGGYAVWQGMQLRSIDAPLPPQAMQTCDPVSCPQLGPNGEKPVEVIIDDGTTEDGWSDGSDGAGGNGNDEGGTKSSMTVEKMGNSSVFVPAIGAYAPVLGTSDTKESRHAGWQTLMIPTNPRKVSWYSSGGDLAGGTQGTTLLAGHIAWSGVNGSFRWLSNVKLGNVAYTKNANGAVQKWKATQVLYREQTSFPQSYWSAEGTRQLVMVTCGGPFRNGHYEYNVFAVFTPVE